MGVELVQQSFDLGIVTLDPEPMIAFYRDVLGLKDEGLHKFPGMHSYWMRCGQALLKITHMKNPPESKAAPGGPAAATGMRYITLWVSNLDEILAAVNAAGAVLPMGVIEVAPGARMTFVEDPDGNWIEIVEQK